jgi:hypothetical protein
MYLYELAFNIFGILLQIECNPEYNTVIGPRTSSSAKSLASVDNSGGHKADHIGEKLPNGIVVGHHASPGSDKGRKH